MKRHHRGGGRASGKGERRWHIPPPLLHGAAPLEGGELLGELPPHLAVLLWQVYRDVLLWSRTPAQERGALFPGGAAAGREAALGGPGLPREVAGAVGELTQVLAAPAEVRPETVARACRTLARWAEEEALFATAVAFATTASLSAPADPEAAHEAGRLARLLGDHARSEVWYRRAVGIARRARDWRLYSRSFRGLGNLYLHRGNLPGARRLQIRALRGARRGGMRAEQAQALHDLFCIEVATGNYTDADRFAALAVEAYGRRNARLPALANDVAYSWMEQGHFARALPVLESVLPLLEKPSERVLVKANIARAAAGTGDLHYFRRTTADVLETIDRGPHDDVEARALLEIALGASLLGEWSLALDAAERTMSVASRRAEAKIRLMGEAVADAARRRKPAAAPTAGSGPELGRGDALASAFVTNLRSRAAVT
jgi:tetratricopeptide (TPR) repeat protein